MQRLLVAGVFVYIFLSSSVALKVGVVSVSSATSVLFLLPIFYRFFIDSKAILTKKFFPEIRIIVLGVFVCFLKFIYGDYLAIKSAFFFMIFPMMISVVLAEQPLKTKLKIRNIVLFFFIVECLLAVFEKISYNNVFGIEEETRQYLRSSSDPGFRSTALLGHPLMNALIVSIIMGFSLISSLKLKVKALVYVVGIIAIFCFNARGAMLLWLVASLVVIVAVFRNNRDRRLRRGKIILFLLISGGVFYYLIQSKGFGDRILTDAIFDASAQARVKVFDFLIFLEANDLIIGHSSFYSLIMAHLGAGGVENSLIVLVLLYGFPVCILLFICYYTWLKRYLSKLERYEMLVVVFSFLLVGSTNNSLATTTPWMFFIFCANCFVPMSLKNKLIAEFERKIEKSKLELDKRSGNGS